MLPSSLVMHRPVLRLLASEHFSEDSLGLYVDSLVLYLKCI